MKKGFVLAGMVCGALAIVIGICIMFGIFGGNPDYFVGVGSRYDKGYASFGADAYTYISNNAAWAASAAEVAACNAQELVELARNVGGGCLFIVIGAFMVCFFGMRYSEIRKISAEQKNTSEWVDLSQIKEEPKS